MRGAVLFTGGGLAVALAAAACALNPQPLPPLQTDDAGAVASDTDAAPSASDSGATFLDAVGPGKDGGLGDATQPTLAEGGLDASETGHHESGVDASEDAHAEGGDATVYDGSDAVSEAGTAQNY
jgi:hypothetical protein